MQIFSILFSFAKKDSSSSLKFPEEYTSFIAFPSQKKKSFPIANVIASEYSENFLKKYLISFSKEFSENENLDIFFLFQEKA